MIDLTWNTNGRIGRRAYSRATGMISFMNVVWIVLGAVALFYLAHDNFYLSVAAAAVVIAILFYLQYRYAQLSIRRLHDRNLPGWLYFPIMLFGLAALAYGGYLIFMALTDGNLFAFLYNLFGLIAPLVTVMLFNGITLTVALLLLAYQIFVSWNLGAEGRAGDNRYGPDPLER